MIENGGTIGRLIINEYEYVQQKDRKNILLLSDDL